MHDLAVPLPLAPYTDPKIELEIMFGLAAAPSPAMDDAALLSCITWVSHGVEIVQSIFPDWKFSPPDTVVADAMHAALDDGLGRLLAQHSDRFRDITHVPARIVLRVAAAKMIHVELGRRGLRADGKHNRHGRGSSLFAQ